MKNSQRKQVSLSGLQWQKVGTNNPLAKRKVLFLSCSLIRMRNETPALILSGAVLGTVFFTGSIFPSKEKCQNQREIIWIPLFFQPTPQDMMQNAVLFTFLQINFCILVILF